MGWNVTTGAVVGLVVAGGAFLVTGRSSGALAGAEAGAADARGSS